MWSDWRYLCAVHPELSHSSLFRHSPQVSSASFLPVIHNTHESCLKSWRQLDTSEFLCLFEWITDAHFVVNWEWRISCLEKKSAPFHQELSAHESCSPNYQHIVCPQKPIEYKKKKYWLNYNCIIDVQYMCLSLFISHQCSVSDVPGVQGSSTTDGGFIKSVTKWLTIVIVDR